MGGRSESTLPVCGVVLVLHDGGALGAHEVEHLLRPPERRVVRRRVAPPGARADVCALLEQEPDDVRTLRLWLETSLGLNIVIF